MKKRLLVLLFLPLHIFSQWNVYIPYVYGDSFHTLNPDSNFFKYTLYAPSPGYGATYSIFNAKNGLLYTSTTHSTGCCWSYGQAPVNDTSTIVYDINASGLPAVRLLKIEKGSAPVQFHSYFTSSYFTNAYRDQVINNYYYHYNNAAGFFGFNNYSLISQYFFPNSLKSSLFFINDSVGFISIRKTNSSAFLYRSNDFGNSWTNLGIDSTYNINAICFIDKYGLAAGDSGKFYQSTDSGLTWMQLPSFTQSNLNAVTALNDSVWYVAGNGGSLFKTMNRGLNWAQETSNTSDNITWLKFVSSSLGYFQTDINEVYRNTNVNGLKEFIQTNSIALYPNPVTSLLNIEFNSPNNADLEITNTLGICIKKIKTTGSGNISINTEDMSSGIYYLVITMSEKRIVAKFLKQ